MQDVLLLQNSLPKAEWSLTGSLPECPVLKYGLYILLVKVVVLLEGDLLQYILGFDVVNLGTFKLLPWNLFVSHMDGDL
jgi:hypothetical protein